MSSRSASPRAAATSTRLPVMPRRGAVSLFEIALLVACIALVAVELPQNLRDVVVLTFLYAGLGARLEYRRRLRRAYFVRPRRVLRHRRLYVDDLVRSWRRHAVDRAVGRGVGVRGRAARLLAVICARLKGPFFILSTLAAAEVVRIGALNWASLTGGPEGLSILPVPSFANMVFSVQDHLRGADARLSGDLLCA